MQSHHDLLKGLEFLLGRVVAFLRPLPLHLPTSTCRIAQYHVAMQTVQCNSITFGTEMCMHITDIDCVCVAVARSFRLASCMWIILLMGLHTKITYINNIFFCFSHKSFRIHGGTLLHLPTKLFPLYRRVDLNSCLLILSQCWSCSRVSQWDATITSDRLSKNKHLFILRINDVITSHVTAVQKQMYRVKQGPSRKSLGTENDEKRKEF